MDRFPWRSRTSNFLDIILHIPVIIPDIILAASLVVAFGLLRMASSIFEPGLLNMIIGHITFQIAFVALVVRSRLVAIGREVEEAARGPFCHELVPAQKGYAAASDAGHYRRCHAGFHAFPG